MKEINNLKYIGSGNNGYWELKEYIKWKTHGRR